MVDSMVVVLGGLSPALRVGACGRSLGALWSCARRAVGILARSARSLIGGCVPRATAGTRWGAGHTTSAASRALCGDGERGGFDQGTHLQYAGPARVTARVLHAVRREQRWHSVGSDLGEGDVRTIALLLALDLVTSTVGCQQLLWQVHSQSGFRYTNCARWFGDLDQDGCDDLLVSGLDYNIPWLPRSVRVLSGADGTLLAEVPVMPTLGQMIGVGDFDGDGRPDFAYNYGTVVGAYTEVWSLSPARQLLQIPGNTPGPVGPRLAGDLDCTGDGLPDLIVMHGNGTIYVHDHFGVLEYTIPTYALGFFVGGIAAVGDLDGDGADDFIVGANETYTGEQRGAVVLVSGRTGAVRRVHWGPQPYDILNQDVMRAGDVDGDGVVDYAAGNVGGFSGLVMVWSGATGALLREWREPVGYLAGLFLAGRDIDLDGRPDIFDMAAAYPIVPGQTPSSGRIRTLSSRDGQDLVSLVPQVTTINFNVGFADLGVQPGNPYPVFVHMDDPFVAPYNDWARIRAFRWSPAGTQFVGQGCSSTTAIPTIGLRRVDSTSLGSTDRSRIVLGSAPPDALAFCVVAPAGATSAGGVVVPTPLDPLGLPGCMLLVPPVLVALRVTGSTGMDRGYADVDLMPALVPTGGTPYAAQWVVLDPITLSFATTARYEFRVQ
ncbi:MAG TPA: VCBS repeat-containing protein [Planctomycetota bacterium]|nr:VCBS repeat-containing protein [Planctomycetota bacterium]